MAAGQDPYKTLGVHPNASDAEIKAAYRRAALKWHPDRNPDNRDEAEERFKQIAQALRVISDNRKGVSCMQQLERFQQAFEGLKSSGGVPRWVDNILRYSEPIVAREKAKRAAQVQREKERPIAWSPDAHASHVSTGEAARQIGISWITLQRWVGSGKLKGKAKVPPLVFRQGRLVRLWSPQDIQRLSRLLPKLRYKRRQAKA